MANRKLYLSGDPRATAISFAAYCYKNGSSLDHAALERATAALAHSEDAFSWERTADILGLTLAKVQELISNRQLKLVDLFVTDRAFEEFWKIMGRTKASLIDPPTAKWLAGDYGVSGIATNDGMSLELESTRWK